MKPVNYIKLGVILLANTLSGSTFADSGEISVQGSATILVDPDIVTINFLINRSAETATRANEAVSKVMVKLLKVANEHNIADKDISTSGISIYASGRQPDRNSCIEQRHQAHQTLYLVSRDLKQTVSLIDDMVNMGALVQGVQPGLDDPKKIQDRALKLAIQDAKNQADTAAGQLGLSVGEAAKVNFISGGSTSTDNNQLLRMTSTSLAYALHKPASQPTNTYISGKIRISQSVQVVFDSSH